MAQVKDFIKKLQEEIDKVTRENVEASQVDQSLDILLRYESRWMLMVLNKQLAKYANSDAEVSVESLQFLIDFLENRYRNIKGTDGVYNHADSFANQACVVVARKLFEELGNESGKQHYYEFLFPGLRCADYWSSKGNLGDLALHEFFWTDKGYPVETLACLDAYRECMERGEECYPKNVCLTGTSPQKALNTQLTAIEVMRLKSHSSQADDYLAAIDNGLDNIAECQKALAEVMDANKYGIRYTYNHKAGQSNNNLLRNGFLYEIGARSLSSAARVLFNAVSREDWINFVAAIDNDMFFQIMLPKIEEKLPSGSKIVELDGIKMLEKPGNSRLRLTIKEGDQPGIEKMYLPDLCEIEDRGNAGLVCLRPNISLLKPENFNNFVNGMQYDKSKETDLNKAILFLLTVLYLRHRHYHEGAYNSTFGQWIGTGQAEKESAASLLCEFFTKPSKADPNAQHPEKTYLINQIALFLEDNNATVHKAALENERLGCITSKAKALGPGKQEAINSLVDYAKSLSQMPGSEWKATIEGIPKSTLQSFIDASGGFKKAVKTQQYIQNNHQYNKAVLFILAEYYLRDREEGEEYSSRFIPSVGNTLFDSVGHPGYIKNQKVNAGLIYQAFLCSDMMPNHLTQFLNAKKNSQVAEERLWFKYEDAIRDKYGLRSRLGTLCAQGEAICKPEYYAPSQSWFSSVTETVSKLL